MKIRALLLTLLLGVLPLANSHAFVAITIAPPPLPVYVQPDCPVEGYLWTPGYWEYDADGYYWVPGVWVAPPRVGYLWTPGYWGYEDDVYLFHRGYWGPRVGFYGGINYGFGYGGTGFYGGRWDGGVFRYNTAVTRVNLAVVHNTYVNRTVVSNAAVGRTSFNGPGGIGARPTAAQAAAAQGPHLAPTTAQTASHQTAAKAFNANRSVNHANALKTPMAARSGNNIPALTNRTTASRTATGYGSPTPSHQDNARQYRAPRNPSGSGRSRGGDPDSRPER